jgi:integrase
LPGEIARVTTQQIDAWLRTGDYSAVTRNNRLKRVKLLFGYARQSGYLPKREPTAAEELKHRKQGDTDVGIFKPEEFELLMRAAPAALIPVLAIGAFAGLRAAEIARLDWSAVDLGRRIIELRAGQAKTASRRIVPSTRITTSGTMGKATRPARTSLMKFMGTAPAGGRSGLGVAFQHLAKCRLVVA